MLNKKNKHAPLIQIREQACLFIFKSVIKRAYHFPAFCASGAPLP